MSYYNEAYTRHLENHLGEIVELCEYCQAGKEIKSWEIMKDLIKEM